MEFKYRAIDDRTPPHWPFPSPSPSPSMSYLTEQALPVNYTVNPNIMHNPTDFYTIQREIEKERIRHEIIMEENVHRRLLEEEVRRELMIEREMVRAREMNIYERLSMQLPASYQLMHPFNNCWLEDRFAFPGNPGMGLGYGALPPTLPHFSVAAKDEARTALEVNKKDKMILLAKPDPNLFGANRKATTPTAGSGELSLMSSKRFKRPKEWSCALCQVSAIDERGLNVHLQGKKHKAKEAGLLRAKRMCNNSTSSMSKNTWKQINLTESRDSAGPEIKTKVEEESVEATKTVVGLDQKLDGVQDSENKNEELPKNDLNAKTPKMKNGMCNNSTSSMSKNTWKQIKLTESRDSAGPEIKTKVEEESVEANKNVVGLVQKLEGVQDSENKNEELPKNDLNAKTPKMKSGILTANRMCNNSTSSMSKNTWKQIKPTESRDSAGPEIKTKVEEESVEANKTVVGLDQKLEGVQDSENKNEELPKNDLNAKTPKMKNGILTAEKAKKKLLNKKNFEFWCEHCQVGTHTAVVMEDHKRGKKHLARQNESKPNVGAIPTTTSVTIVAPSEPTEKAEDEDVEAKEANEETAEKVTGDSDGTGSSIVGDEVDPTQQTPWHAAGGW